MNSHLDEKLRQLPTEPGVYLFYDDKGELLYVGKASILRQRVRQYFQDGYAPHNPSKQIMIREIADVQWEKTGSEIEALVREAHLIKERNPKYNITLRDDKNFFWVLFSKDSYPRISLTHQPFNYAQGIAADRGSRYEALGPFTDGKALKKTLAILRSIFPYCTCKKNHYTTACLNAQMGRCPGYCCLDQKKDSNIKTNSLEEYYRVGIRSIRRVLMGRSSILMEDLNKSMSDATEQEEFEIAAELRDQIEALKTTLRHAHVLGSPLVARPRRNEAALQAIKLILGLSSIPHRIEAYDVANLKADSPTASMVVAINGRMEPKHYRQFHLSVSENDTAGIAESLSRRLRHPEWQAPSLILVDGGMGQLHAARSIINLFPEYKDSITLIALAKKEEELYREDTDEPTLLSEIDPDAMYLLQQLRDEAHRFARKLHHQQRSRNLSKKV